MTAVERGGTAAPKVTWEPSAEQIRDAEMTRLIEATGAEDYDALWEWSVTDVEGFWSVLWDWFGIRADGDPAVVLADDRMPGAWWFPDVALSYPEHIFRDRDPHAIALHHASELAGLDSWTWARLADRTAGIRAGLRSMGVTRGDRVVGYLPNVPETLAAFLAVSSLGAVWSCCSPDLGPRTAADRFAQIEPKVLLAVDGYRYGGRTFDREDAVRDLQGALPTLERTIVYGHLAPSEEWDAAFPATDEPLAFERVPFDHPLWIVYSSGTTGLPKAIVHGHGGPLLEHLKAWRLHHDVKPDDRVFWFTTTGWIMWNYLVGALLTPASIVLFDGNPGHPDLDTLWDLADRSGATLMGTGAAFLHSCMKADVQPRNGRALARLRSLGSTGSPLAPEAYDWVAEHLGSRTWLTSISGGTDIASAFVGGCPLVPVIAGELQARMLGVAVEAWDDDARPVYDGVGELVVTKPMPSMPVGFWNDPDGARYRDAYFDVFPGVWRHGDWIRITPRGSAIIHGRSDSTINRGGIRIGTAEIYAAVQSVPAIADALAIDLPLREAPHESRLVLFVVLTEHGVLDDALRDALRRRIRADCSPRHVPDVFVAAPAVPRTLTGKLLEVPIKKLLTGADPVAVANRDALADPSALDWFAAFASSSRGLAAARP